MTEGWQTIEVFDDEISAQAMVGRLRVDGVPAAVKSDRLVPGVGTFHVLVPAALADRARWILAQAESTEAELNYLATGELAPHPESEDR